MTLTDICNVLDEADIAYSIDAGAVVVYKPLPLSEENEKVIKQLYFKPDVRRFIRKKSIVLWIHGMGCKYDDIFKVRYARPSPRKREVATLPDEPKRQAPIRKPEIVRFMERIETKDLITPLPTSFEEHLTAVQLKKLKQSIRRCGDYFPHSEWKPSGNARFRDYYRRSLSKNLPFQLSVDYFEFLITSNCYYCGGKGGGVDRIDSKKGYTVDNSRPCCGRCNMMKYTGSEDEFLAHVQKIAAYQSGKSHLKTA